MTTTIPSLWPDQIKVDILPPLVVLKAQAAALGRLTQGIVDAQVTSVKHPTRVEHRLDLVVPALDDIRHRILTISHSPDRLYPVTLDADCYRLDPDDPRSGDEDFDARPVAATYDQFIDRLREVFQSPEVMSAVQSLIARSNERLDPTPGADGAAA